MGFFYRLHRYVIGGDKWLFMSESMNHSLKRFIHKHRFIQEQNTATVARDVVAAFETIFDDV